MLGPGYVFCLGRISGCCGFFVGGSLTGLTSGRGGTFVGGSSGGTSDGCSGVSGGDISGVLSDWSAALSCDASLLSTKLIVSCMLSPFLYRCAQADVMGAYRLAREYPHSSAIHDDSLPRNDRGLHTRKTVNHISINLIGNQMTTTHLPRSARAIPAALARI